MTAQEIAYLVALDGIQDLVNSEGDYVVIQQASGTTLTIAEIMENFEVRRLCKQILLDAYLKRGYFAAS